MSRVTIKQVVLCAVLVILLGILAVRYHQLNDAYTKFDISERDAAYGEYQEEGTIGFHIFEPKVEKIYSKEYQQMVYRYTIPFDIKNVTDFETFELEDFVLSLAILSGGEKWQGTAGPEIGADDWVLTEKDKVLHATVVINVIPNETLDPKLYREYELYRVDVQNDVGYKVRFL